MTDIAVSGVARATHSDDMNGLFALPQGMFESVFRQTYDMDTGAMLSRNDSEFVFSDIKEAEAYLFMFASQEESVKIQQIKALLAIKRQRLYTQKFDDDGEPFGSFEAYLKYICKQLIAVDGAKPRSIKSWMTRVQIFQGQLGKEDLWLLRMGYHAEVMLPLAARDNNMDLAPQNEPTETGGQRLGKPEFTNFADEIAELVFASQDDPSKVWTIRDTKERVNDILQKKVLKVSRTIDAEWIGEHVVIKNITWWVDDVPYTIGNKLDKDTFTALAGQDSVRGLGDSWNS